MLPKALSTYIPNASAIEKGVTLLTFFTKSEITRPTLRKTS